VGFKELYPNIPQNLVHDAECPRFSQVIKKINISDNMYEQSDIPAVGKEQDSRQPATKETEEKEEKKKHRLTTVSLH
jgi:hypothetical protein